MSPAANNARTACDYLRPVILYLSNDVTMSPAAIVADIRDNLGVQLVADHVEEAIVSYRWGPDMFRRRWWDRGWPGDIDTGGPVVTHRGGEVVQ